MINGPVIKVLERAAKGQIDSAASEVGVLPLGQWLDAVKRQALGAAPHHHVAVE